MERNEKQGRIKFRLSLHNFKVKQQTNIKRI